MIAAKCRAQHTDPIARAGDRVHLRITISCMQIQMARLSAAAWSAGETRLPARYRRYQLCWELLGYPAFCATVVIYFLMVMKPI
ncbi:MAG: DUF2269 family protein [Kingella oralis]